MTSMEFWAGVECTVNRVGDTYHSQFDLNGHDRRPEDLDLFASLGIQAMRYPVLWERASPSNPNELDLTWAAESLQRLRSHQIAPIVGLVHHGSGPRYTSLIDPAFPTLVADYARAVAREFPWVTAYTPINEPLTTARFSGLYGLWYPHGTDDWTFAKALVNESCATVLAMEAIRTINPNAKLIQTDDLGRASGTPRLQARVQFENDRRWLAWDLLCGRVNRHHPFHEYLIKAGVGDEVAWLLDHPCPPDVIGINHYLTSNRFLHEERELFDRRNWGMVGDQPYADVEAVRVMKDGNPGVRELLVEAWERYRIPLAITEAHLGCTREEQLRWLDEVWREAHLAREDGADVRAVTAWALLGSFNWNSLLTRDDGHYEPGAFDVRAPQPRPTALAHLIRELATGSPQSRAAVTRVPGWWRRPERRFASVRGINEASVALPDASPVLITGASGSLGRAFARICSGRGLPTRLVDDRELDICDLNSVHRALEQMRPWAVVNAAGYMHVDEAERNAERCYHENTTGAATLARACAERDTPLLTFSSDLVFDGEQAHPYVETHNVRPLNVYGLSKARAERQVLDLHEDALIVRTSSFFDPWDNRSFLARALQALSAGECFQAMADVVLSPTYMPDFVHAALDLLIDGERGLWHLANAGAVSWAEFVRQGAVIARVETQSLQPCTAKMLDLVAPRPAFTALTSERGLVMPSLESALERYAAARAA